VSVMEFESAGFLMNCAPRLCQALRRATFFLPDGSASRTVAMVQAADLRLGNHPTQCRRLDGPRQRRIALQRPVTSANLIIVKIRLQQTHEMPLVPDDHVVEQLAPYTANKALRKGVLPGTSRCRDPSWSNTLSGRSRHRPRAQSEPLPA
jgi:hypothetical protein